MKRIEKLDQARKQNANLNEWGINRTFYWAYEICLYTKNETLNFDDTIWDSDVKPIIEHCKEFGIKEITISSTYSGAIKTLGLFADNGCKVLGLVKVKSQFTETNSRELKKIYAVKLQMP